MSHKKIKIIFLPYKLHFRYFLFALANRNDVSVLLPPEKSLPIETNLKGIRISYRQFGINLIKNLISNELRTQKYVKNFSKIVDTEKPNALITCEFYHWYTLQALFYKKQHPQLQLFVVSETKLWPKNFLARQVKKLVFTYFKLNSRHVDAMLVYTEQARNFLATNMPEMQTVLVPAPIDSNLFCDNRDEEFYKNNTLNILFNARYSAYKRHDDLFAAVLKLTQKGYKVKVTCISRDSKRVDYVKELARMLGLQNIVIFKESMPLSEMPKLYRTHDILVLPSYNEAIGMVVPEAMSCGRPTVTSDTVGANVYVRNGVTGFIFSTGDINSLAKILVKCCDQNRLERMGAAARRHIIENYSADQIVRKLEAVINIEHD